MKHTPGPWHWDSDPIKGDPLGRSRYRVTALGRTITQVYYTSEWSGQAEADAKLIAAAPDLLEALECLLPGLTLDLRYADEDDDKDAMQSRIKTVCVALAKAYGSSEGAPT